MDKTIVFIHGAWLNALSWENMMGYFEGKGYKVSAPEWPYRDPNKSAAELRENPPAELAQIGVKELTDHYESIIRDYPQPPILIGHSFGGLIVQQLLDRGYGSAGVAFDAAAPEGVLALDWNVLKINFGVLSGWMNWEKVVHMSYPEFQFAFVNTYPEEEQQKCYDHYCTAESGRLFFQAAFAPLDPHHATYVDFSNNSRAPLLLTAGELDHIVPAHVSKSNFEHYLHSGTTARTDFKQFDGRSHLITAGPGWEEVAGYAANWLEQLPG
jgi:pimeloyl-ACP methyl ester carboxylesterase